MVRYTLSPILYSSVFFFFQQLYAVHLVNELVFCCFQKKNGDVIYFYGSNV